MRISGVVALVLMSAPASAQQARPVRPAHTYSIVAVDPASGEIGAAVQSHWFSVGSVVPWAEPGVGAVATQSFVDPSYGPRGLYLMRTGVPAPEALAALLRADPDSQVRQVAMIDAHGRVAAHTGSRNIPAAGYHVGAGYSVQANLMRNDAVWPAMARAFESAEGDLAARMLAALQAAEQAGGDIRGRQSAALVVVSGDPTARPWEKIYDLRVEDSADPLGELARLLRVARAYRAATEGDNYLTVGNVDSALAAYSRAAASLPDSATNGELVYWQAVTLADLGRVQEAVPLFRRAFAQDRSWVELLWRLPRVGLLRADSTTIASIVRQARR
ncbi:MAG: DUF1028 domain-containing protein [Gemmatimonadales bacterium]|nr:DUF1028 domain-containing protein [Gemmatimonadales bacterium]NIN50168.1 DUF1028 domain-containing protein [Gemmatimonadales bacterium]NIP07632.1 DUF1028 domain-containing protein [Gemmatimonadales bacterium]NIR01784.1 DUF1028 domain-containing protein [Gemmatimonadales bacterium]NIS65687.1 DUF1028 domain-containing protein [Gemmatimonadales bacterium]